MKVQHAGVDALFRSDIQALKRILNVLAWLFPDFALVRTIIDAFISEILKELDFGNELRNLVSVHSNLRHAGFDVILPKPLPTLCTSRILTMDFVEGFKVTRTDMLDLYEVDRTALMIQITEAYAQQLFVDAEGHVPRPSRLRPSGHADVARKRGV